jgi:hypothetical protein
LTSHAERINSVSFVRFGVLLYAHVCPVSGIGHKIKSVNNPDLRVELVKEYVLKNFPSHTLLDYALAVEKVTTSKKDTVSTGGLYIDYWLTLSTS